MKKVIAKRDILVVCYFKQLNGNIIYNKGFYICLYIINFPNLLKIDFTLIFKIINK